MPPSKSANRFKKRKGFDSDSQKSKGIPLDIKIIYKPGPSNINANGGSNSLPPKAQSFSPRSNDHNLYANVAKPGPSSNNANKSSKVLPKKSPSVSGKSYANTVSQKKEVICVHQRHWKATHSQASLIYSSYSRGFQCCATSLAAMIILPKCKGESSFTPATLDLILQQGDSMYKKVTPGEQKMLEFKQFHNRTFEVNDKSYKIDVRLLEAKDVDSKHPDGIGESAIFVSLGEALLGLLVKYDRLWVLLGEFAISIVQCFGSYYVFDSHERLTTGEYQHGACAALWSFQCEQMLLAFIRIQMDLHCTEHYFTVRVQPVVITEVQNQVVSSVPLVPQNDAWSSLSG